MKQFETTDKRQVILCNQVGEPTGTSGIADAHRGDGRLHRAFSVFVFRQTDQGAELLIQRRSEQKLLFGGYWANTCCSHPAPADEDICQAGAARLRTEFGFSVPLRPVGNFVYRASDPRVDGTEYEYDTVLLGLVDPDVQIHVDPAEIADYKWVTPDQLRNELDQNNASFAPWFRPALEHASAALEAWP